MGVYINKYDDSVVCVEVVVSWVVLLLCECTHVLSTY